MSPDRRRQIEALYNAAREHGAGVLADTQPGLRREVEKLLQADSGQDTVTVNFPSLTEGRIISHYRIHHKLGGGGMGVVCLAKDLVLGRPCSPEIPSRRTGG